MTMTRTYWMVQYAKSGMPLAFSFCESRNEAEEMVAEYQRLGYSAAYWQM